MTEREILDLYDAHARELVGFFARRTGDPQLALDLLGDTFLAAFAHRRRCRAATDRERAAWLFKIAANTLAGHFRRGGAERRATSAWPRSSARRPSRSSTRSDGWPRWTTTARCPRSMS